MASADFSRRRAFLRRPPFKDEARSPQVRMVVFPAQPPDLRRSPLVARVRGQLSASPGSRRLVSGSCSSARGFCSPLLSAPASRPHRFPGSFALRFARGRCDQLPPGLSPVHHRHAGHTRSRSAAAAMMSSRRRELDRCPADAVSRSPLVITAGMRSIPCRHSMSECGDRKGAGPWERCEIGWRSICGCGA